MGDLISSRPNEAWILLWCSDGPANVWGQQEFSNFLICKFCNINPFIFIGQLHFDCRLNCLYCQIFSIFCSLDDCNVSWVNFQELNDRSWSVRWCHCSREHLYLTIKRFICGSIMNCPNARKQNDQDDTKQWVWCDCWYVPIITPLKSFMIDARASTPIHLSDHFTRTMRCLLRVLRESRLHLVYTF